MSAAQLYPIMAREPLRAMFTGLVQSEGRIERRAGAVVVWGCAPFAPLALGDSVAVDGVCLTAAELMGDGFRADVSEETLRRTTLGRKADRGGAVNLEPALRLSDRLGGHLVSGHVDAIGEVTHLETLPTPGPCRSAGRNPDSAVMSVRRPASRWMGSASRWLNVQQMERRSLSLSSPTPGRQRP